MMAALPSLWRLATTQLSTLSSAFVRSALCLVPCALCLVPYTLVLLFLLARIRDMGLGRRAGLACAHALRVNEALTHLE